MKLWYFAFGMEFFSLNFWKSIASWEMLALLSSLPNYSMWYSLNYSTMFCPNITGHYTVPGMGDPVSKATSSVSLDTFLRLFCTLVHLVYFGYESSGHGTPETTLWAHIFTCLKGTGNQPNTVCTFVFIIIKIKHQTSLFQAQTVTQKKFKCEFCLFPLKCWERHSKTLLTLSLVSFRKKLQIFQKKS